MLNLLCFPTTPFLLLKLWTSLASVLSISDYHPLALSVPLLSFAWAALNLLSAPAVAFPSPSSLGLRLSSVTHFDQVTCTLSDSFKNSCGWIVYTLLSPVWCFPPVLHSNNQPSSGRILWAVPQCLPKHSVRGTEQCLFSSSHSLLLPYLHL